MATGRKGGNRGKNRKADAAGDQSTPPGAAGGEPRLIVGIGASAGGLESLKQFFSNMPPESGIAFVVIQHLQQDRKSMMAELLSAQTKMPVSQAEEGTPVLPDHVYVIPPGAIMTIADGILHLEAQTGGGHLRYPINAFFSSLAVDWDGHAVAIVMSGAGSDGTIGVRTVKENGGLAMAEAISHDGPGHGYGSMPDSAIATGLVDIVARPSEMPQHLLSYVRHVEEILQNKGLETLHQEIESNLGEVCNIILIRKGRDFRHYKPNTLIRRIQRRMQVLRLDSVETYIGRLREDEEELDQLARELLIVVTSFFRDEEAFATLKEKVIKPLVQGKGPNDNLRIWVPGCATGEEAYSIAILIQEARTELEAFPAVQIFATDLDPLAVEAARAARYPKGIEDNITPERLHRFFLAGEDHYRVSKEIRELCIFSEHDLIQDPPFSRLDLVSCRNLLIYLDPDLQKRVIPLLHYALREEGYLFLGISENVTHHQDLFAPVDKKHRIFRHREKAGQRPLELPLAPTTTRPDVDRTFGRGARMQPDALERAEHILLDRFGPAYVIVDENFNVIRFSRGTGKYLEQPAGAPRTNAAELARRGLGRPLRNALQNAADTGQDVVEENITVTVSGSTEVVDLTVSPVQTPGRASLFLVIFRPVPQETIQPKTAESAETQAPGEGSSQGEVERLEHELAVTTEDLQTTVEELETSNEELQSSNEELLSMNEELQSSNEELETSKEELQSVNEELETVNQELNHKVTQLDEANSDLKNLLNSTDIATVFLDREIRIKWFTPTARRIFNLIDSDIGRPITDIAAKLDYDRLAQDLQHSLETQEVSEREVTLAEGEAIFMMRIHPYRDSEGQVTGTVLTFVDVTRLRASEHAEEYQALLARALQHRVKNILASVRSVYRETVKGTDSLEDFTERFDGRLNALALTETIVARTGVGKVDLHELAWEALPPTLHEDEAVHIDGPTVLLESRASQMIALAINELVTNAIKYGALSDTGGRVNLSWSLKTQEREPCLEMVWEETGVAIDASVPAEPGFGLTLIERGLPYELDGTGKVDFGDGKLTCTITIPMAGNIIGKEDLIGEEDLGDDKER